MQVVGKAVEPPNDLLVAAHQCVVAQHRRDGHSQAQSGHDQSLTNGAGHLVDAGLTGRANLHQRVVNAPDRAKQAHKRRGRPDRGQHRQARLQVRRGLVDGPLQAAGDPVAHIELLRQSRASSVVLYMVNRLAGLLGELSKRVVCNLAQHLLACSHTVAMPKGVHQLGLALVPPQMAGLEKNHHP